MATVNQIYSMVNAAADEALGSAAIAVKDTATLVSLGDVVLSSTTSIDTFYQKLCDKIGRLVISIRPYEAKERSVMKNDMEWGIAMQKLSFKKKAATSDPEWDRTKQASPYDIEGTTEIVQKIFSGISVFDFEDSHPTAVLFTAFKSAEEMAALISGIYTNMQNAYEEAKEVIANLAVDTYMAGALIKGVATQKRNLLSEYNTLKGTTLTAVQFLENEDALAFAANEISKVTDYMKNQSVNFNAEGIPRFTDESKMVVEILKTFDSALKWNMKRVSFDNEFTKMPNYEVVNYWQGTGTSNYAFADVSKINIQNASLAVSGSNVTGTIAQSGIIAFVHDVDAVSSIINNVRRGSLYNDFAGRLNIWVKAEKHYACDLSENGVVFYLGE